MNIETVSISLPAAILMGLAFGSGPCNITCLPYLGPVLLKNDRISQSWRTVLPFSLGRMSGYALLGLAAGYAGQSLANWFESQVGAYLLGTATILIGVQFIRRRPSKSPCSIKHTNKITLQPAAQVQQRPLMPGALFSMGAGMALNPCVPLTAVLAAAAASGSMFAGMSLGLAFGLGAVLIPTFVFAIAVAHFGVQLRTHLVAWRSQLELSAAGLLILLGTATIFGWIKP